MWSNIINELKISTILEKVALGIIAGIFAIIGYYVGYTHLSNGVQPVLIGIITAVILMVACMLISFIGEELLKQAVSEKKQKSETAKEPNLKKDKVKKSKTTPESDETETKDTEKDVDATADTVSDAVTVSTEPDTVSDASTSLQEPSDAMTDTRVRNSPSTAEKPVTEPVKASPPAQESAQKRNRREAGQRLKSEAVPLKEISKPVTETAEATPLSLEEYIAAHPDYAPRKMAREYRAAGGSESTDDILKMMS